MISRYCLLPSHLVKLFDMLTYDSTSYIYVRYLVNVIVWLLISLKSLENQIWLMDLIND